MTQRRAEELYQNELAKYNEDNSMLTHAARNERRWVALCCSRFLGTGVEMAIFQGLVANHGERLQPFILPKQTCAKPDVQ